MIHVIKTDGNAACGEKLVSPDNLLCAYEFYTHESKHRCKECHEKVSCHLPSFVGWGRIVYD